MSVDFTELLDSEPIGEIEKPKPLPEGSYAGIIKKIEFGASRQKKTPYVRFHVEIIAALDDVDANALEEFGDLNNKTMRVDQYVTENTKHMLKDFLLLHVGIEAGDDAKLSEVIPEAQGREVGLRIGHEIAEASQEPYATVSGTFALED